MGVAGGRGGEGEGPGGGAAGQAPPGRGGARGAAPVPPPRALRGPGSGIAYYLLPQLSKAQFPRSRTTNRSRERLAKPGVGSV